MILIIQKISLFSMPENKEQLELPEAVAEAEVEALGPGINADEDTSSLPDMKDPFDPAMIRVERNTRTVDILVARLKHDEIDLAPGFQRKGGIWRDEAQSKLIESLLIRIPIPAFYVDASEDEKWLVVDGLQRLTTLKRFIIDKTLKLQGLDFLKTLNGLSFDELPRNLQRRIRESEVTVFTILPGTPPNVKFTIFKRINTGGLPLSSQEIRHALNQGPVTELLKELASCHEFKTATRHSIRDDRMADRECVLRFFAFYRFGDISKYKSSDFDGFLNETMAALNKEAPGTCEAQSAAFRSAMNRAHAVLGRQAFRKFYAFQNPLSVINKALFEAWSVNFARLSDEEFDMLLVRNTTLVEKFPALLINDPEFAAAVTQSTGDPSRVRRRFDGIYKLILDVITPTN